MGNYKRAGSSFKSNTGKSWQRMRIEVFETKGDFKFESERIRV